jgi:hypothetical protein
MASWVQIKGHDLRDQTWLSFSKISKLTSDGEEARIARIIITVGGVEKS